MSTPGRKRVQPIIIEDDDDDDHDYDNSINNKQSSITSSLSDINLQDTTPSLVVHSPGLCPSSSSLFSDSQESIKKNPYVALNIDELSHIRNAQTNSEFAILLYDFNLYKAVVNGHICFSCRKVNFSLLQADIRCTICLQRICSKCQRKFNCHQDNLCFVSLNLLRRYSATVPSTFQNNTNLIRKHEQTDSESPTSSSLLTRYKSKNSNKKSIIRSNNFICCIDCFVLFDPAKIV